MIWCYNMRWCDMIIIIIRESYTLHTCWKIVGTVFPFCPPKWTCDPRTTPPWPSSWPPAGGCLRREAGPISATLWSGWCTACRRPGAAQCYFFGGGGMASRRVSCPDACVCVAYTRMCVQYTHIASIHKSINSICIHTYRFHTVEPQRSLSGR